MCMRECLGPFGHERAGEEDLMRMSFEGVEALEELGKGRHKRVVCSRCCCERGADGEVWCLGCLGERG